MIKNIIPSVSGLMCSMIYIHKLLLCPMIFLSILLLGCSEKKENEENNGKIINGDPLPQDPELCNIILNPNNRTPLAAVTEFTTNDTARVTVRIEGDLPIENENKEFKKDHKVPIIGLYPDKENTVTISVRERSGNRYSQTCKVTTEAIKVESYIPSIQIVKKPADTDDENNGELLFLGTAIHNDIIFDKNGDIRWYFKEDSFKSKTGIIYRQLRNGNLLVGIEDSTDSRPKPYWFSELIEIDFLGDIKKRYNVPNYVHHGAVELPSDNIFALSSTDNGAENAVVEIDKETGEIVTTWNLDDHLQADREPTRWSNSILRRNQMGMVPNDGRGNDWCHGNSIDFQVSSTYSAEDTYLFLISCRNQDAVIKFTASPTDLANPTIQYILGMHNDWDVETVITPETFMDKLLNPNTDFMDSDWPIGQHSVFFSKNENGFIETSKILMMDNHCDSTASPPAPQESHLAEYTISIDTKTISKTWEYYPDPRRKAEGRGSIIPLSNGNRLAMWPDSRTPVAPENIEGKSLLILEITPAKQIVFQADVILSEEIFYGAYNVKIIDIYP